MKYIKNISLIVVGMALVLIYWKGCSPCDEIGGKKETIYTKTVIKKEVDSTYYHKYYELLDQIPEEKPLYSRNLPKKIIKNLKNDSLNGVKSNIKRFTTSFSDSTKQYTIKGKITSLSTGIVLSTDINYDIKSLFLKENTIIHDSIFKTIDNYVANNKLYLGIESSLSPSFNHISLTIDFMNKKGLGIGYRFENNFNNNITNSHNIRITKNIF